MCVCVCVCLILASVCILLQVVSEQEGLLCTIGALRWRRWQAARNFRSVLQQKFLLTQSWFQNDSRAGGPFFCALQLCRRKFLQIRHQFSATLKSAAAGRAGHDCKITFFADQISPSLQHVLEIRPRYLTNFSCSTSLQKKLSANSLQFGRYFMTDYRWSSQRIFRFKICWQAGRSGGSLHPT